MVEGIEKLIKAIAKFGPVIEKMADMMKLLQKVITSWFAKGVCIVLGKPLKKVCT